MHHTRSQSATNAAAAQATPPSEQQQQHRTHRATKPQPAVAATASPRPSKRARRPSAAAAAAVSSTAPVTAGGGAGGGAGAGAGVAAAVQVQATPAARGGGGVGVAAPPSVATDVADATSAQATASSSSSGSAGPSDADVEAILARVTRQVIATMKYKPQRRTLTTAHLERAVEVFKAGLAAQEAALLELGPDFLDFLGMPALQLTTGMTNLLANSSVLNSKAVPCVKVMEDLHGLWLVSLTRQHSHHAAKATILGQLGNFTSFGAGTVFANGIGDWRGTVSEKTRCPDAGIARKRPGVAPTVLANEPIVIFEQEAKNRSVPTLRELVDEYFLNPCMEVVIVSKLFIRPDTGRHCCGVVMYQRTAPAPAPGAVAPAGLAAIAAGAGGTYAVTAQLDIGPTRLSAQAKNEWAKVLPGPPTVSVPEGAWVTWTSTLHPGAHPRVTWAAAARPAGMPQPPATTEPYAAGVYAGSTALVPPTAALAAVATATSALAAAKWPTSPTLTIPRARLVSNVAMPPAVAAAAGGVPPPPAAAGPQTLAPHGSFAGLTLDVGVMLDECMQAM